MASTGTLRGTPTRGQGRGNIPNFNNSPAPNSPRPGVESHGSTNTHSDIGGGSTMSASRAKQSKRDEVCCIANMQDFCRLFDVAESILTMFRLSVGRSRRTSIRRSIPPPGQGRRGKLLLGQSSLSVLARLYRLSQLQLLRRLLSLWPPSVRIVSL